MPVLPAVPSTTMPPGLISPRFSASRMIWRAARSLTDWPGFMNSALPRMVQPVASDARSSLISGVLPMASTMPSQICMIGRSRRGCAGNLVERLGDDKAGCAGAPRRELLGFLHPRQGGGTFADDQHPGFLVLGAVPVHLLGEMRDEGAGRHRHHVVGVELVAGRHPPRPLHHS